MKKTEILKVRVDKETHTALMRYCEGSKQSPSYVLRKVLGELIQEGNGAGMGHTVRLQVAPKPGRKEELNTPAALPPS